MKCLSCGNNSHRILVINGTDVCSNCGLQETGGAKIDGSITRNSSRIREQQQAYKSDLTPAWTYDKNKRRTVPSTDFVKLFPEQATKTFTNAELKDVGITKLKGKV